jgi:hypothetical protein
VRRACTERPRPVLAARAFLLMLVALAATIQAGAVTGQASDVPRIAGGVSCAAPVLVPPWHWAAGAIQRLELAGPYEMATAGTGSLPLTSVRRALAEAAVGGESPAVRSAASDYLARLETDYPADAPPELRVTGPGCAPKAMTRVEVGYAAARGLQRPGFGYDPEFDWTGAFPVDPVASLAGAVEAVGVWGPVGARIEAVADGSGIDLRDAHVAIELSDVVVWAGHRAFSYGPASGGGIVFGGLAPVTGVGAVITDPIRLPGILGFLGPVGAESFFSRAKGGADPGPDPTGEIFDPWLWGVRLTSSPHPRFRLAVSRGTMFGGEGNTPVTLRYAAEMLLGMHSGEAGELDNHFGSADLRYNPPGVPLDLYLEWGIHDSAGSYWRMPARIFGIRWSAISFAPGVGVGAEVAHFPRTNYRNPIWYRNWAFRMGWTTDGQLLGHPMGGHGTEASLRTDAVLGGGGTVVNGRVFFRDRGDGNLFAPQWSGTSLGADASLHVRWSGGAGAALRGFIEGGEDWRAGRVFAGMTWTF